MLNGKPYLSAAVEAASVPYAVYVNGAFVAMDRSGGPANETWPINHYLRDGRNELAIVVNSWLDEQGSSLGFAKDASVQVTLRVRAGSETDGPTYDIARLKFAAAGLRDEAALQGSSAAGRLDSAHGFEPASTGDVAVYTPRIEQLSPEGDRLVRMEFDVPLAFSDPAFLSSDVSKTTYQMSEDEALSAYAELLSAYEVVWKALAKHDYDKIMPMFEERSRETDRALYLPAGTTQRSLRNFFEKELADSEQQLAPLRPNSGYWTLDVSPNGRLMRLSWGDHGSAIIRLVNKEYSGLITEIPIVFRKDKGRLIVAR